MLNKNHKDMKRLIYFAAALMTMPAVSACNKDLDNTSDPGTDPGTTPEGQTKDAKGQWLVTSITISGTTTDEIFPLILLDISHTVENAFIISTRVAKEGYDPSAEETPSKDPYDPNYEWIYSSNAAIDSSDKTTEGEWTVVNCGEEAENMIIKYKISSDDVMTCIVSTQNEDDIREADMTVTCTRLDPPVKLVDEGDK